MLSKNHRLPSRTRLISPRTFHTNHFILKVSPNKLETSRFGFIISKRITKKAVERNRTKRILRSCIEQSLRDIVAGNDFLFIFKQKILNRETFSSDELHELLIKNKLIC